MVISSLTLSWLAWEFLLSAVAALGGVLVFWGLWIEKKADKKWYANLDDFKSQKSKAEYGWKILMLGIFVEIVVAVGFAVRDDLEIRQTRINEAKIDPLNQPIAEISAIVSFTVKEDRQGGMPNWTVPKAATMFLCESNASENTNAVRFFSGTHLNVLEADKVKRYFDGTMSEYVMNFHNAELPPGFWQNNEKTVAWALKNVRFLEIETQFLPHEAEISGGSAVVTINSGPQKWFTIEAQRDSYPDSGKQPGYGYQVIASVPFAKFSGSVGILKTNAN